jgi:hypothetical protein
MAFTSVQISREASKLLDDAAQVSGLRKGYLADTVIKNFLDPDRNPGITDVLARWREESEQEFVGRVFKTGRES